MARKGHDLRLTRYDRKEWGTEHSPTSARQPAILRVLPMELQIGDRLSDETDEWEVAGRPYTTVGGKNAGVRVRLIKQPTVTEIRVWGAHERVSERRAGERAG